MKYLFSLLSILACCIRSNEQSVTYATQNFQLSIAENGNIIQLQDRVNQTDYAGKGKKSALFSIMIKDSLLYPEKAVFSKNNNNIKLTFLHNIHAVIEVLVKKSFISFRLQSITNDTAINAVIWGPYHTTITNSIGETVGIVQNEKFTVGLQALNPKTLGGYPWKDDDHLPQLDILEQDHFDVAAKVKRGVLYSVEAAMPTETGSSLQAYTRNRAKDRIIENWGHPKFVAPAYADGGLAGSGIALFGCPTDSTLDIIGQIEIAMGLPHPMIDGVWSKKSPYINASYLIMDFAENNIEQAIDITKKAGFNYLYHGDPFETWGHYELKQSYFPNGIKGLKNCVDKAMQKGIRIGTHTLTNFINTNDAYVSPIPDKRLAVVGSSKTMNSITADQNEIQIEHPDYFNQYNNNNLRSVLIDDEIIRYGSVSDQAPWVLKDCQRGAYGTKAAAHKTGSNISKLFDHGYKVFLGNAALNKEIAENIADVFNKTGIRMLDFDGLEGAGSTGMGNYGEALFAKAWYDHLNESIKSHYLLGASRPGHYFWHLYSRMNWGEPWYAGFRESQTEYRLANQKYFARNLMPGMLGWFKMTASTTIEDIEWLMARSAGYHAGFAFVTDLNTVRSNGSSDTILATMKLWEQSRLKNVFSKEQSKKMQDVAIEFHLEKQSDKSLSLNQVYSYKFKHIKRERQPGEPLFSTFEFENMAAPQNLQFIISATTNAVSNISFEINQYKKIELPCALEPGQTIKYNGGNSAIIYDKFWNKLKELTLDPALFHLQSGKQTINFDCSFGSSADEAAVKIEFRLKGSDETIRL